MDLPGPGGQVLTILSSVQSRRDVGGPTERPLSYFRVLLRLPMYWTILRRLREDELPNRDVSRPALRERLPHSRRPLLARIAVRQNRFSCCLAT